MVAATVAAAAVWGATRALSVTVVEAEADEAEAVLGYAVEEKKGRTPEAVAAEAEAV